MSTGLYWKELPAERKWKFIPYTPTEVRKAIAAGAAFTTWLKFSHEPGNGTEPVRYGDPVLDFDCKEDPARAVTDARRLIAHLSEYYGIDPDALKLSMSGGKGCHVKMPAYLFGAEQGHERLHLIYKSLVQRWKSSLELSTLDMSLYAGGRGKMFRLPNVRRENGRCKVPVTWTEFATLSQQALDALTENPRKIEPVEVDRTPSELLVADFQEALNDCTTAPAYEPLSSQEMARMAHEEPPCISKVLLELPEKSDAINFNKLVGLVVNFYQGVGASYEEALERCNGFLRFYPHSETYDTEPKRRAEFDKIWKFMLTEFGYFFSCERMKALGLEYDCLHCIKDTLDIETASEASAEAEAGDLVNFPTHVYSGAAGRFATALSEFVEVPSQFLYFSHLTCMGSYFSPRVTIASMLRTQPRIYVILLGESATERKSTALDQAVRLFGSVFHDFVACKGMSSAEGLQKVLRRDEKKYPTSFGPFGVCLYFDELRTLVSKCKIESSVLLPTINTLYEQNFYASHTKNTSINIDNAYLSLLAATTKDTYEKIYDRSFLEIGFPNRTFIVPGCAKRRFSLPPEIPEELKKELHHDLLKIKSFVNVGKKFDLTDEAKKVYHSWYMDLDSSVHAKRLDTISVRLMLLIAINDMADIIDVNITQKAIDLCNWQLKMRQELDPIDADNQNALIEEKIRRALASGPLTDRDLKRKVHYNRHGIWLFTRALENLKKGGEIKLGKPTGTRSPDTWHLV